MDMKYSLNHQKTPLQSTFFLESNMGTISRLCTQEMDFGTLSQNEACRVLVPEIGLKSLYIPISLASW
jgi:hypothetical protein